MTNHRAIALGFVVAFVLSPGAPVFTAEEEQKGKDNVTGEATVGVAGQDQDPEHSAKFSEFREVPNGFTAERLFLTWSPKEGFYFDLRAQDVSQLDQRIGVSFGGADLWRG
ncbi:MAG TPA: hypothetical protein VKF61_01050, partial [Candidatus Polarisedimenticolia bacterium]|nr:hypothetical protein [Candidatus Polarisedimenticolia bacterium]